MKISLLGKNGRYFQWLSLLASPGGLRFVEWFLSETWKHRVNWGVFTVKRGCCWWLPRTRWKHVFPSISLGLSPLPVRVTTRIITFLVGNPYKLHFHYYWEGGQPNISQVFDQIDHFPTHTIHVWYIYRQLVDFYGFHVGKYTSPMDPMG